MDIAHGEAVEVGLTRLIEKRAANGEVDPDEADPGYMESVRWRERGTGDGRIG